MLRVPRRPPPSPSPSAPRRGRRGAWLALVAAVPGCHVSWPVGPEHAASEAPPSTRVEALAAVETPAHASLRRRLERRLRARPAANEPTDDTRDARLAVVVALTWLAAPPSNPAIAAAIRAGDDARLLRLAADEITATRFAAADDDAWRPNESPMAEDEGGYGRRHDAKRAELAERARQEAQARQAEERSRHAEARAREEHARRAAERAGAERPPPVVVGGPMPSRRPPGRQAARVLDTSATLDVMPTVSDRREHMLSCVPPHARTLDGISVQVRVRVAGDGAFRQAQVVTEPPLGVAVQSCLASALRGLRLPDYQGESRVVSFSLWLEDGR